MSRKKTNLKIWTQRKYGIPYEEVIAQKKKNYEEIEKLHYRLDVSGGPP